MHALTRYFLQRNQAENLMLIQRGHGMNGWTDGQIAWTDGVGWDGMGCFLSIRLFVYPSVHLFCTFYFILFQCTYDRMG